MIHIDNLINKGFYILNPPKEVEEKTLIILGIARSGTTLIAKIINNMGIYIGDKISEVKEDIELASLLENKKIDEARELIEKRNQKYKIWSWKRPEAFLYYELWKDLFRNPHFIVVFRDPLGVSIRNYLSVHLSIDKGLILYKNKLEKLLDFILQVKEPVFLISFEKIFKYPKECLENLISFTGINHQIDIEKFISIIQLEPVSYLLESRIKKTNEFPTSAIKKLSILDIKPKIRYYPCEELEFMNVDVFQIDLLRNKLTIGGLVLLKKEVECEYKLMAKADEKEIEAKWRLPSPGLASKYPDNPKAKEARFQLQNLSSKVGQIEIMLNQSKIIEISLFEKMGG